MQFASQPTTQITYVTVFTSSAGYPIREVVTATSQWEAEEQAKLRAVELDATLDYTVTLAYYLRATQVHEEF